MNGRIARRSGRPRPCIVAGAIPLAVFALAAAWCNPTEAQAVKGDPAVFQAYDPAKDETGVAMSLRREKRYLEQLTTRRPGPGVPPPTVLELSTVFYSYPGKNPTRPRKVSFTFRSGRDRRKFQANRNGAVSADGTVVHEGQLEAGPLTIQENNQPVEDVLTFVVPVDAFLRVARAKKVRFRIGPEDYNLDGDQSKKLRILADMMETPVK